MRLEGGRREYGGHRPCGRKVVNQHAAWTPQRRGQSPAGGRFTISVPSHTDGRDSLTGWRRGETARPTGGNRREPAGSRARGGSWWGSPYPVFANASADHLREDASGLFPQIVDRVARRLQA